MTLLLDRSDAEQIFGLQQAIVAMENVLRQQADHSTRSIPPQMLYVAERAIRIVAGGSVSAGRVGVRLSSIDVPSGRYTGTAHLYDVDTGSLLCVMAFPFGRSRVSATMAIAIRAMASAEASRVGLVGTGRNALGLLEGALAVRPITDIRVFSRDEARRRDFCQRASEQLKVEVVPVGSAREAADNADVILTGTSSATAVIDVNDLGRKRPVFIGSMGQATEIAEEVYLAAGLVVVGDKEQEQRRGDNVSDPFPLNSVVRSGQRAWSDVRELWQVAVLDGGPLRLNVGITVFKDSQGGCSDSEFMSHIYERAIDSGVGSEFNFER